VSVGLDRVLQDQRIALGAPLRRRRHREGNGLALRLVGTDEIRFEDRRRVNRHDRADGHQHHERRGHDLGAQTSVEPLPSGLLGHARPLQVG
jgi:hypothetical protein